MLAGFNQNFVKDFGERETVGEGAGRDGEFFREEVEERLGVVEVFAVEPDADQG